MVAESVALDERSEQTREAYDVACKIVDNWPNWKKEIVSRNSKISPAVRAILEKRNNKK